MQPISTDSPDILYVAQHPVLVIGDGDGDGAAALAAAGAAIQGAGLRLGDQVPLASGRDRIARQIATAALWIELGGASPEDTLIALLDRVQEDATGGRYPAVVSARSDQLDLVAARLNEPAIQILIDADDAQRAAAGAVLATGIGKAAERMHDVASDRNAARLRQLSDEVSRIASTLARLSSGPTATPADVPPTAAPRADAPEVSADVVRSVIRARRLRARFFSEELFADPAWDMLLDLLQAEIAQLRVPVSSLCIAAAVPATTALRWLKAMVSEGLFVRRADPHDGRRVFVELSPDASSALRRYFAEVGKPAVI